MVLRELLKESVIYSYLFILFLFLFHLITPFSPLYNFLSLDESEEWGFILFAFLCMDKLKQIPM